jgi:hypothetical protein
MGGLLSTASPLDMAQQDNPFQHSQASFGTGLSMPVSSSANLPTSYERVVIPGITTGGGKVKNNKTKSKR